MTGRIHEAANRIYIYNVSILPSYTTAIFYYPNIAYNPKRAHHHRQHSFYSILHDIDQRTRQIYGLKFSKTALTEGCEPVETRRKIVVLNLGRSVVAAGLGVSGPLSIEAVSDRT